jgi:hypothetical protein
MDLVVGAIGVLGTEIAQRLAAAGSSANPSRQDRVVI